MTMLYFFLGILFIAIAYPFVKWYILRWGKQREAQEKNKFKCVSCKKTFDHNRNEFESLQTRIFQCTHCFLGDAITNVQAVDENEHAKYERMLNEALTKSKLFADQEKSKKTE